MKEKFKGRNFALVCARAVRGKVEPQRARRSRSHTWSGHGAGAPAGDLLTYSSQLGMGVDQHDETRKRTYSAGHSNAPTMVHHCTETVVRNSGSSCPASPVRPRRTVSAAYSYEDQYRSPSCSKSNDIADSWGKKKSVSAPDVTGAPEDEVASKNHEQIPEHHHPMHEEFLLIQMHAANRQLLLDVTQRIEKLRRFAVWNAVAVVKILKKRRKIVRQITGRDLFPPCVERELWLETHPFYQSGGIQTLVASVETFVDQLIPGERKQETENLCAICLEPLLDSVGGTASVFREGRLGRFGFLERLGGIREARGAEGLTVKRFSPGFGGKKSGKIAPQIPRNL